MVLLGYLNLKRNGFDGVVPECIGSLIILTWLDLSNNDLSGAFPIGLRGLKSTLGMSYCKF
jgi:Leucine-rich repeat (LRR) protein